MTVTDRARSCAWQDPSRYHWLHDLDRAGFAWEFLRRDSGYRAHVEATVRPLAGTPHGIEIVPAGYPGAAPWGLSFRGRP